MIATELKHVRFCVYCNIKEYDKRKQFAVRTGIQHYLLSFTGAGDAVARRKNESISHFKSRLLLESINKLQYASETKEKPTLR